MFSHRIVFGIWARRNVIDYGGNLDLLNAVADQVHADYEGQCKAAERSGTPFMDFLKFLIDNREAILEILRILLPLFI